jgi:sulfopropanediol 3-dehydrogenase
MYYKEIKKAKPVAEEDVRQLQEIVSSILQRVKKDGDSALRYYEKKFDNYEPTFFLISPDEAAKAKERLPSEILEELDFAIERVTAFAQAQKESFTEFEKEMLPGIQMGQRIIPVAACLCYVPAGRYPCLT